MMEIKEIKLSNGRILKMVYLNKQDKENIKNMHPDCNVYSTYDDTNDTREVIEKLKKFKKECCK